MEIAMATGYMDASDAAYDTLAFLVDLCGAGYVLSEFFYYMDVDRQVEFVHDFIRYNNIDTHELIDEIIDAINEHYEKHC